MGTKINPGPFNCQAAALPDEEIFTILARDPAAPDTITRWIIGRIGYGKYVDPEDQQRIDEAHAIRAKMVKWREANLDPTGDGIPSWKLPRDEEEYDRVTTDAPVVVDARQDMASHFTAWRTALFDKALEAEDEGDFTYYLHELEKFDHCFRTLGFADEGYHFNLPKLEDRPRRMVADAYEDVREDESLCTALDGIVISGSVTANPVTNDEDPDDDEYAVIFDRNGGPVCAINSGMVVGGTREAALTQANLIASLINAGLKAKMAEQNPERTVGKLPELAAPYEGIRNDGKTATVRDIYESMSRTEIPDMIYWNKSEDTFYGKVSGRPQSEQFRQEWFDRRHEFPTTRHEEDLAKPDEVPGHRFAHFHKAGRYAYAKGLEVSPVHLPVALDAMAESGWDLLAIFGATDTKNIGFIFQRRTPSLAELKYTIMPGSEERRWDGHTRPQSAEMDAYESGKPIAEIVKDAAPTSTDPATRIDLGRGQEP